MALVHERLLTIKLFIIKIVAYFIS
jgi:hypothetical protein